MSAPSEDTREFPFPPIPGPELLGRPSRKAAAVAIKAHLEVLKGGGLKGAMRDALAAEPKLGGQERRFVAFATRELSRHQRLLDLAVRQAGQSISELSLVEDQAVLRYAMWRKVVTREGWTRIKAEVGLPGPVRPRSLRDQRLEELLAVPLKAPPAEANALDEAALVHSFPRWLAQGLAASVGEAEAPAVMESLNREPTLILRARPPGARESCLQELQAEGISARALEEAPDALLIEEYGTRVFDTQPMRRGQLQSMDLGSQLIVELCRPAQGFADATVIDFCAGAGGKTLALADRVGKGGRVFASDLSSKRLREAKNRVAKFSIRNVAFPPALPFEQAQVVLVDAPCSGTGSLAREPEQKWKLTRAGVAEFQKRQIEILTQLVPKLSSGTVLVYATCSLLRDEGEAVIEALITAHPELKLENAETYVGAGVCVGPYLRVLPHRSPGGGFFAARLKVEVK